MGKKFVIRSASLYCQYGENKSELKPFLDRRIQVNHKDMANASDIKNFNACGGFGICKSPHRWRGEEAPPPCIFKGLVPWQNVNSTVQIGKEQYGALMEDGWTVCSAGYGIVTLVDSGQPDENHAEEMLKKLEELENIIDEYMEANNIPESKREGLLESVLLWKGYAAMDTSWEYKSTEENRAFCTYLMEKYPSLANYFGSGLFVVDKNGDSIDLNYMLGVNKALNGWDEPYAYLTMGMIGDRGMYNGYLEACRQQRGQGVYDALGSFLNGFMGDNYDAGGRYDQYYNAYYDIVTEELRCHYCCDAGIDQSTLSVEELNSAFIGDLVVKRMKKQGTYDTDTSKNIFNAFENQLKKDVQKGG